MIIGSLSDKVIKNIFLRIENVQLNKVNRRKVFIYFQSVLETYNCNNRDPNCINLMETFNNVNRDIWKISPVVNMRFLSPTPVTAK